MLCFSFAALGAALFSVTGALADSLYTKKSPVLQVDVTNFDALILKSNYTSLVEFYAPWCGHCQNLKPHYERAAEKIRDFGNAAAVNCNDELNQPLCQKYGVQGFPTIKIFKPSQKPGKPTVESYMSARITKELVKAVKDNMPNHVTRLSDKNLDNWLAQRNESAKVLVFSEKGTTSAILKALAIDYLGQIDFAIIREKETRAMDVFGITALPTLVFLPGGSEEPVKYDLAMNKEAMTQFLSQFIAPNPPSTVIKPKSSSKKSTTAASKSSKAETIAGDSIKSTPTESPAHAVIKDDYAQVPIVKPLPSILSSDELGKLCLTSKTPTCLLVLEPSEPAEGATAFPESVNLAFSSLAEIAHKHAERHAHLFPFYRIPATNPGAKALREKLELDTDNLVILAINGRREWWRRYEKDDMSEGEVEDWVDSIRLGEGEKKKVPEGVIGEAKEETTEKETGTATKDETASTSVESEKHDEL